jgi:hypothetical protein
MGEGKSASGGQLPVWEAAVYLCWSRGVSPVQCVNGPGVVLRSLPEERERANEFMKLFDEVLFR